MRQLTIYRLFFTKSDCYRKGTIQRQRGVQVHDTGANNPYLKRWVQPDDGRLGQNTNNNSHNRPGGDVCASAYVGKLQDGTVAVYQALPWDMRCWLSGSGKNGNGNRMGYIGFEICRDNMESRQYFEDAVMDKAVLLTAALCQLLGAEPWTVVEDTPDGPAYAVMDHIGLHRVGCASNHGDIGEWLEKFGYTFEDFRRAVDDALDDGVEVTYIDALDNPNFGGDDKVIGLELPVLKRGDEGADVILLQALLTAHGLDIGTGGTLKTGIDGKFGARTESAVKTFQEAFGLAAVGQCGTATWAALMEQDAPGGSLPAGYAAVEKLKLTEAKACLTDALGIVSAALTGDSVG